MAGFVLLSDRGTENSRPVTISSLTLAVGDLLELDVGATAWTAADSSTEHWQKKAVVMEPATTSDTEVLAMFVVPGMVFEVESANTASVNHNGDRMLLTDKNTVNNSGTDSTAEEACFLQLGINSVKSTTQIVGEVIYGTGINPDAA